MLLLRVMLPLRWGLCCAHARRREGLCWRGKSCSSGESCPSHAHVDRTRRQSPTPPAHGPLDGETVRGGPGKGGVGAKHLSEFMPLHRATPSRELTFHAGLEDEGHALPSRVVDPERAGGEGGADRVVRDGVVIEVAGLAVCGNILAEEGVFAGDGRDAPEDLDLRARLDMPSFGGRRCCVPSRHGCPQQQRRRAAPSR